MTAETVDVQIDGVVTTVAESLPAGMAFLAAIQSFRFPYPVTNILLSDLFQIVHVVEAHVLRIPNAILVLRRRALKKRLGAHGEQTRRGTERDRRHDDENHNEDDGLVGFHWPSPFSGIESEGSPILRPEYSA